MPFCGRAYKKEGLIKQKNKKTKAGMTGHNFMPRLLLPASLQVPLILLFHCSGVRFVPSFSFLFCLSAKMHDVHRHVVCYLYIHKYAKTLSKNTFIFATCKTPAKDSLRRTGFAKLSIKAKKEQKTIFLQ